MTTCKDCYRRNPATGYCPVRTYEVEEDHEPCGSYATPPRDMNAPAEEATKTCKRCGKELPLSSFSRNRNGLLGVCKDCMKAAQKKGAKPEKPAEPEAPKEEPVHPELHESEDERIRKDIIDYLSNELHNVKQLTPRTNEFEDWIAYLERRKEQKPAEWSGEDEEILDAMIDMVSNSLYEPLCPREGMLAWLKAIHPAWKPSEEQIRVFLKANPVNLMPEELSVYNSLCNDIQKLKADPAPDYEKKYKDALGWMKQLYPHFNNALREDADRYFPELPELCPDVIPTKLMPTSGGISYPSALYAVESWKDETVRFFLKDVVHILRDRGYQVEASIIVTEKL